jgi:hypothetical protein
MAMAANVVKCCDDGCYEVNRERAAGTGQGPRRAEAAAKFGVIPHHNSHHHSTPPRPLPWTMELRHTMSSPVISSGNSLRCFQTPRRLTRPCSPHSS